MRHRWRMERFPRRVRSTRRGLVLQLLQAAASSGVTTSELLDAGAGPRYSARLLELRERGYAITSERAGPGQWRYRLEHEPDAGDDLAGVERRAPTAGCQAALFDHELWPAA